MTINRYVVLFTAAGSTDQRVVDSFSTPLTRHGAFLLFKTDFLAGKYDHLGRGTLALARLHSQTMQLA